MIRFVLLEKTADICRNFLRNSKTKKKYLTQKNDFELILKLTWLNNKSFFSLNICLVDKISCYCRTNLVIVGKTSLVRLKIKGLWIVEKMQKKCFHSKQKGGSRTTFCFWNNFYVNETEIHNVWKYSALSTSSLIFFYYLSILFNKIFHSHVRVVSFLTFTNVKLKATLK